MRTTKGLKSMGRLLAFLLVWNAAVASSQEYNLPRLPVKRSYVCPPNFIRLSHRCYYFSNFTATWQEAFWHCRDLHSNLAIIKNANQEKHVRQTLQKDSAHPAEWWLGALYDWEQMTWKWAASGKPLTFQAFGEKSLEDKEQLRWHCIILDPRLQYRWTSRSCLEHKQFLCHTKLKIVSNKDKKKLQRQYNASKNNKLNEIPVPVLPEDRNVTSLKDYGISNEIGAFARVPNPEKRKKNKGRGRKGKGGKRSGDSIGASANSTVIYEIPRVKEGRFRKRRNRGRGEKKADTSIENIKWKTYYNEATVNPLYPRGIVEEFVYAKN